MIAWALVPDQPAWGDLVVRIGQVGDAGLDGTDGDPGQDGTDGGSGESLNVSNSSVDATNELRLTGGIGGEGGRGGNAIANGFAGGNGGRGGDGGNVTGSVTTSGTGEIRSLGSFSGGDGGVGGDAGAGAGVGIDGSVGRGGDGGTIVVGGGNVVATSSDGRADSQVQISGGDGGSAIAEAGSGGNGGSVVVNSIVARSVGATDADVEVTVTGGNGGNADGNGAAGNGGNATVVNAVDGDVNISGEVYLSQQAYGGLAGATESGAVGVAGSATNELTKSVDSASLNSVFFAEGGYGSDRNAVTGTAGDGATATATIDLTNTGEAVLYAEVQRGDGGSGTGGASGGNGASNVANMTLRSTLGTAEGNVVTFGGDGGAAIDGDGNGGNGGSATVNLAVQAETDATALGNAFGGVGGYVEGTGSARHGGTATGSISATSNLGLASSEGFFLGGYGGAAVSDGTGGNGASVTGDNLVTAASGSQGSTYVYQSMEGGEGSRQSGAGGAGSGGSAFGRVDAVNSNVDSTLISESYGGEGGRRDYTSGLAGDAGFATAQSLLQNTGTATSAAFAIGGIGGEARLGTSGGAGANAVAESSSISIHDHADATADAYGGDGGITDGSGSLGGSGADANATAFAQSQDLDMTATSTASSIAGFGYDASQLPRSFRSGFAEATATSKSLQGVANATAIAEGRVARSTAIADGSSGSAVATSASIGVVDSIPSNDPISVGNTVTANVGSQTRVESYTATDGTMWSAGDISNDDAFSLLTLNPSASDVQSLFAGQNNFLDSQSGYEVVAVGRFGGGYPATGSGLHTFSINTEMTFNEEDFGGKDVFLSFDDFEATDNAFETLTLSLVADNFNFFRSFADRNEAQLFFTDNSVSLGSLSGLDDQFKMQIDWSSTSAADSFAANYGMSIRAVPEPHASVGILISGGIWFLRKRSRSRRRNGC